MDKNWELTPEAIEEGVSKVIELAVSTFLGRILKAVDNKLSEVRTPNPTTNISSIEGSKSDTIPTHNTRQDASLHAFS